MIAIKVYGMPPPSPSGPPALPPTPPPSCPPPTSPPSSPPQTPPPPVVLSVVTVEPGGQLKIKSGSELTIGDSSEDEP